MKKFIMLIESLVKTFSIIDAGEKINYKAQVADNTELYNEINVDDAVLGYYSEPIDQVKCVFKVVEKNDASSLVFEKILEVADGSSIADTLVSRVKEEKITEISNDEYNDIFNILIDEVQKNVVDLTEENDIFDGFKEWLTSWKNPEYTGTQKYAWYPNALIRLVNYMYEQGLISDPNLNIIDVEKYREFLEVFKSSEDAKEYDKKHLKKQAGSAALKKYINYIKYLSDPHAEIFDCSDPVDTFDYLDTSAISVNKIFFGVPGCGKSYHVEHEILGKGKETREYEEKNIIRTTFYQDYSNSDFVGQILPKITKGEDGEKDKVEYIFNPGPFTLALIRAISNPTKKVALVIEEINRGNAPAIFGDIFQLLDRDENSISEYGIHNVSLMDYLNDLDFDVDGQKKKYVFNEIKIPGNMDIFATMNTSDQNVYTLDTAFVRRWDKEKIKNSFDKCTFKDAIVPGMKNYTWKEFVEGINNWIAKHLEELQINEDKQIGVYFVKETLLTSGDAEKFAFKVFDYLWSDVAKLDHSVFFNHYDTLEDLIKEYKSKGVGVFKPGIFEIKDVAPTQSEENNEQ